MKKILTILSLSFIMTIVLVGCGAPSTLEEFINSNEDAKNTVESMTNDQMSVEVSGNTLTYLYTYNQTFTGETLDALKEELENAMESQKSTFENIADTLEKESGIDEVTVQVIYANEDGTEIYKEEF